MRLDFRVGLRCSPISSESNDPLQRSLTERRDFATAVEEELKTIVVSSWQSDPIAYVERGRYAEQLERYFNYCSRNAVLILDHDELLNRPGHAVDQVGEWLGLEKPFPAPRLRSNISRYSESPRHAEAAHPLLPAL